MLYNSFFPIQPPITSLSLWFIETMTQMMPTPVRRIQTIFVWDWTGKTRKQLRRNRFRELRKLKMHYSYRKSLFTTLKSQKCFLMFVSKESGFSRWRPFLTHWISCMMTVASVRTVSTVKEYTQLPSNTSHSLFINHWGSHDFEPLIVGIINL